MSIYTPDSWARKRKRKRIETAKMKAWKEKHEDNTDVSTPSGPDPEAETVA